MQTLRRKPRSAQQKLADEMVALKQKSFAQLGECFGRYVPAKQLCPTQSGAHSRRRFYSRENTFWAFFSQVLDPDGGCREVVSKLQAYAVMKSLPMPSSAPAAYCNARKEARRRGSGSHLQAYGLDHGGRRRNGSGRRAARHRGGRNGREHARHSGQPVRVAAATAPEAGLRLAQGEATANMCRRESEDPSPTSC